MNLGNEVNVKNFHVLKSGQVVTAVMKEGKVYFKIQDVDTSTDPDTYTDVLTTDQFCLESIKRVRLTKPTSCVFKKWEISIPGSLPAAGTLLTVYMHFTNLYGYGITDRWEKFATVAVTTGITGAQVAWDLAERINAQYIQGMRPVKATAYNNSNALTSRPANSVSAVSPKVVITDNTYTMQTPTRRRMERNMDPQPIEMFITTNILEGADTSWASEVATAASNGKKYDGVADTSKTYKNAYLIWGLEKVSQLNSTETMADPCTGFIGYDSVMDGLVDGEMDASNVHNYWVLDIAYETLPKMGVPSARNLKEVSFAAVEDTEGTAPVVLTDILAEIGGEYTPVVATPVATRGTGANKNKVTVTCSTDGATIKYTTDGSTPTSGSSTYSTTVTLTSGQTFKAKAFKDGYKESGVTVGIAYE